MRLHDLRYTCATILLMAGKHPKFVQELLGHASTSTTLDSYSHVVEGMDDGLKDAVGRGALRRTAAALLPPGILAVPGSGEIRIHKPMRP